MILSATDKKIISAALLAAVLLAGLLYGERFRKQREQARENAEICIQVITPARNIKTGEIRDFPTPCDVPVGWEKI